MSAKPYLLALVPVAAAWLYAVSQSAERVSDLFAELPQTRAQDAQEAAARSPSEAAAQKVAPAAAAVSVAAQAVTTEIVGFEFLPVGDTGSAVDAARGGSVSAEPLEHPEITDPRMRALLEPAWAD